jgi:uncharacterized secreted protein with C-terminal beta-propeller domain
MSDSDGGSDGRHTGHRVLGAVAVIVAAAAVVAGGLVLLGSNYSRARPGGGLASDPAGRPVTAGPGARTLGGSPEHLALVAYDTCGAALKALREHAADAVKPWGFARGSVAAYATGGLAPGLAPGSAAAGPAVADSAQSAAGSAGPAESTVPDHSTTNDQEAGADEPDIVKSDGRRVVAISGGVLRVVDAATRTVTGSADLRIYAGAEDAELLMSGDRVLVLLGGRSAVPMYGSAIGSPGPGGAGSTFLLIDVAAAPKIVSTMRVDGGYVDARLIGGRARVVVDSAPQIALPSGPGGSESAQLDANRAAVRAAPLAAWRPTYQTSIGGVLSSPHPVPCDRISHPEHYRGDSLVTVYTLDPATTLDDPNPVSVAADGATVYASTSNLYVASTDGANTELHRFAVGTPGRPRYVGSGTVPGWLLNSYAISEYAGALRVVTTSPSAPASSLYVLDADTLRRRGEVGGLGVGERLHAVRFLGPLAYVVTFRSVDPLYVLDLRDPAHPRRAGELKIPGYSDYLHPTDDGRLLGVGQNVDGQQRVSGVQVSLFDVSRPTEPRRLDVVTRARTPSETPIDPHAFLYWPATRTAVVPLSSWTAEESGAALVLHVDRTGLRVAGTVRNPATAVGGYDAGIIRSLVVGSDLWTMSGAGLRVSDLGSLDRRAWISFG